jgi:hypothetical protein
MEEMSEFMTLPDAVKINSESLPYVDLEMVITSMEPIHNEISYKFFLRFNFAPDVAISSEEHLDTVSVSKKAVEDLFRTYNNILDTIAVFKD